MRKLLTPEEFSSARESTLNAHYTSPVIIQAMYQALERTGFKSGKILEPACGLGHFIGLMPQGMHEHSTITGIELDGLTARLAKGLYPDADIRHEPFEKSHLVEGSYDVAISNVPFGDYQPFDPKFNLYKFRIHDYFFASALDKVKPGGLVLFITSKGTLDKKGEFLRKYLSHQSNFLGAIRLPNNAFLKNANTQVTTDIVMLQKLEVGKSPSSNSWQSTMPFYTEKGEEIQINEYFAAHPEMMLGRMTLEGGMYGRNESTLASDGRDLEEALNVAVSHLPEGVYQQPNETVSTVVELRISAQDEVKPFAYTLVKDQIARREGNELVIIKNLPDSLRRRILGMMRVRDAVRECLRSQLEDHGSEAILSARTQLNHQYDWFVSRFGPISERSNVRAFNGDPDLPLLLSLEHYDEERRIAKKTAIFHERTIHKQEPAQSAQTPKEALIISLNENGKVDLGHMSWLLKRPIEEILPELKGVIYRNPQTEEWEPEDRYLSGNIREKLALAEAASLTEPQYKANADALRAVIPTDLTAGEIDARLGAVWIPETDIRQFAKELLNLPSEESVIVSHSAHLGAWSVQGDYSAKGCVANTTEWGTNRASALSLLDDALNLRAPTIYDTDPQTKNQIINASATEAAREKQEKIKEKFREWLWNEDDRRRRLVRLYNDGFNNVRLRTFNGDHLTLPGASQTITLRPHQKAAVWRILQTPNTLLAHVVGAGKTYTMVTAGMELKRLGLAKKPLFVVPNHMLGQFSSELLTLYPGANILVAGKDDFEKQRRQQLFSRIVTGNWDAVIVTHSGFERIPMSQKAQEEFFEEQLFELEVAIREQRANRVSDTRLVKDLERAKKRLETRMELLAAGEKKDDTLTFEELGVDRIFVDEAHAFKNLFYVTKMSRVAGLPQSASERAFDMFLKTQYIQKINGGGGVVFATGTPVTNTMAEMYTMQRFLQMNDMKKQRLHHFDSWAATFGEPVTAMELSPDGSGYRLNTRFARFVNVPELMQQYRQMADIQTAEMLKLPIPKLHQGKAVTIAAPATAELKELVASLAKRAEKLKNGNVDPSVDNMLKITGEGRKAALDLRLVKPRSRDYPESKVNLAVREIFHIWQKSKPDKSTQLVFCDLSTPKGEGKGFSVYDDIKEKLIRDGVPDDEIAFIQDYDSDADKAALFKKVRDGNIRILMGSTQKMGTGTNVQHRLIASHHLDPPWRPADIEQRDGRILRQGNRNAEVKIFRYVTEGSFDAYMWQTLETKVKFISQVMIGENTVRKIEDLDAPALTYAEVKAIASGNPLVHEKASVDAEVMRLCRLRSQHDESQYRTRTSIRHLEDRLPMLERHVQQISEDIGRRQNTRGDAFEIVIQGTHYEERTEAGEALIQLSNKHRLELREIKAGAFAGFKLALRPERSDEIEIIGRMIYYSKISASAQGTISSLEHTVRALDDRLIELKSEMENTQQQLMELKQHLGRAFEHGEKLKTLLTRQEELVKELDITKNQAPDKIGAEEYETNIHSIQNKIRVSL